MNMIKLKAVLLLDIESVIENLNAKKKYLKEDSLPAPLSSNNILDEDIAYLEKEILPKIRNLTF